MKNNSEHLQSESGVQEEQSVSPRKRRRKFLLIVFFFLLLLLGFFVFGTAAAIFTNRKSLPLQPLRHEDLILQQKLIRRISREVFSSRPRKESQLVLSAKEIESLFRLIDYGCSAAKLAGKYKGLEPRYFEPVFFPDRVQAIYPLDTGYRWLFGGVMRWEITATPKFDNNMLTVNIHDCRLGIIPLPGGLVEKFLLSALRQWYTSSNYKLFCNLIKKVYMKGDGSLVVIYHPAKLLPLLTF